MTLWEECLFVTWKVKMNSSQFAIFMLQMMTVLYSLKKSYEKLDRMATENVIFAGDFNLALNVNKDRLGSKINNNKSAATLQQGMELLKLTDIWRDRNPDKERYSWFRKKPELIASRIDYLLVNQGLQGKVLNIDYSYGCRTDHSLVFMEFDTKGVDRGPGIWKLNNRLLQNEEYIHMMRNLIKEQINVCNKAKLKRSKTWETVKFHCAEKSKNFAVHKQREKKCLLNNLRLYMEKQEDDKFLYASEDALQVVLAKIKELENEEVQSSVFHSRCTWNKYRCKSSKYFFSLEKRNYNNKTMFAIILDDGTVCKEQKRILHEQVMFYKALYSKDPTINFKINNSAGIRITDQHEIMLSEPLSKEEIRSSVNSMSKGKVCGSDGLPIEFYVTFYAELEELLYQTYLELYEEGVMVLSMRQGVITLIPKKNKDPRVIKNLRPLTLLNSDFKILAKAMASRLKLVLPDFVGPEQTGFMSRRNLHDNLRKTIDIVTYISKNAKRAVILSIDFEKCFDRIEHNSIFASFRFFGIPESFVKWTKLFFNKMQICMHISEYMDKTRGVNQGCPISPFCYNAIGAVLALLVKENPSIQGIKTSRIQLPEVITQFADDTGLYLEFNHESLEATINTLTHIEQSTGLKVSYEKTNIYRVGSLKGSNAQLYTQKSFSWTDDDIEMLGVIIQNSVRQTNTQFNEIIVKMENIVKQWWCRDLPLLGKILLINTLMGSLFTHAMMVLPKMFKDQLIRLDQIIVNYLWKGKKQKIALDILRQDKDEGGQRLVDFDVKQDALQLKWVLKAYSDPSFMYVSELLGGDMGSEIWKCNLHPSDVVSVCKEDSFWRDIRKLWARLTYYKPQTPEEVKNQIIWNNSNIKIKGKLIPLNKVLSNKGLNCIADILNDDGTYLTSKEFMDKFATHENEWLWYHSLIKCMPTMWKIILKSKVENIQRITMETLKNNNANRIIYNSLLNKKYGNKLPITKYANNWFDRLHTNYDLEKYRELFRNIYTLTNKVKLRDFQYRLLLGKIFANDVLFHWKVKTSNICEYCEKTKQTTIHLMVECEYVRKIWEEIFSLFDSNTICWKPENIMNNSVHPKKNNILNLITLIVKQYIYRCKCQGKNITTKGVLQEIYSFQQIESYNAAIDCRTEHHRKRWSPVQNKLYMYLFSNV